MSPPSSQAPVDPFLRRIERDSAIACAVLMALAIPVGGFKPDAPLGVLAGAALMAFSYRVIRGGVDALANRARAAGANEPGRGGANARRVAWAMTRYITRYGVLAVAAWVVLVPLRASPLAVFVGVSVPVVAIGIEAARQFKPRRR
jgi:hypothetical protein